MSLTVIIIDDDESFRNNFSSLLRKRKDIKLIALASNGLQGIYKCELLLPDIVFLDINMPGMAGPEVANIIKRISPDTKIFYVSFHEKTIYPKITKFHVIDGYIQKNFIKKDLPKVINQISEQKRIARRLCGELPTP
jgi:DNA-binding NarL/FixJ family response regulator